MLGAPPPPQLCGEVQVPHESVPPQPLAMVPQVFPCAAHDVGVQGILQMLAEQTCGAAQGPQSSVPPHPSGIEPQFLPTAAQEVGMQLQLPASASHVEQAPARQETKPSATQSSSRRKPSWQYLTELPSQEARSLETEHSLPVSTHSPTSHRFKVGFRPQSERTGMPAEQLTATVPSQDRAPPSQVCEVWQRAPPSSSTTHVWPPVLQSPRKSPSPTQVSASAPRHWVFGGHAPRSQRPTRAKKTESLWQVPP